MRLGETKVSNPEIFFIKVKTRPRPPKTAHLNTSPQVYVTVWKICITPPKCICNEKGVTFILAVVLLLPPAPCPGDAVFRCESESTLFDLLNEYTTKNQWLSCIYNIVPEQYNANIQVCATHFSWSWERVAYNVNTMNGCEQYKVGQFQRRKDSLVLLTHSL